MARTTVIALLALLAGAGQASAATVSADEKMIFRAADGEKNRLQVSQGTGSIVFVDPGARMRARRPCRVEGRHRATCPGGSDDQIEIFLGYRSDRVEMGHPYLGYTVHGGPGDDVLTGGAGYDNLYGDKGRDVLRGGTGGDSLHAGAGRDRLYGERGNDTLFDDRSKTPTSPDLFDGGRDDSARYGGPGDTVDYSARRVPLDLDLARTPVNRSGEGDRFRDVESLTGGAGDDRIFGRGGADILIGDPREKAGDDLLSGGGARDVLWGEGGSDRLLGGDGGDLLIGLDTDANDDPAEADTKPDRAECGSGSDSVRTGPHDTVVGCEHVDGWTGNLDVTVQPSLDAGHAVFSAACRGFRGCTGEATMRGPKGTLYGRTDFKLERDQADARIDVPLTPAGRDALARGGVVVVVEFRAADIEQDIYGSPVMGYRTVM